MGKRNVCHGTQDRISLVSLYTGNHKTGAKAKIPHRIVSVLAQHNMLNPEYSQGHKEHKQRFFLAPKLVPSRNLRQDINT